MDVQVSVQGESHQLNMLSGFAASTLKNVDESAEFTLALTFFTLIPTHGGIHKVCCITLRSNSVHNPHSNIHGQLLVCRPRTTHYRAL